VVGIDIGGTNTVFGIIDKEGNILAQNSILTNDSDTLAEFIELLIYRLIDLLNHQITKLPNQQIVVKAIGIGAPNGNYYHGTIENAVNLKWKGIIPFAKLISSRF